MKPRWACVLLLALAGCASGSASTSTTPSDDVEFQDATAVTDLPASDAVLRAEASLVEGDLRGAKATLEAALAESPRDPRALFDLALVLELGDDLVGAEQRYREVIVLIPDFAEALNNLGLLLRDREQLAEARALLERAIAVRPGYGEAHGNLGLVLEELGELDAAIGRLRAATRLLPEDPMQHANLGFALLQRGDAGRADARVSLLRARRLATDDAELLREIGSGLRAAGEGAEALRVFEGLIAATETDEASRLAELHVEAALCAVAAEQGDVADRHAREAARLDPDHAGAQVLLGRLARARGDRAAARAAYERAARLADADSTLGREAREALEALR